MFNRFDRFNMRKVVRNLFVLTIISFTAGTGTLFISNGGKLIEKSNNVNSMNQIKEVIKDNLTVDSTKEINEENIDQVKEVNIDGVDEINIGSTSTQIIVVPEKRNNVKAELSGGNSNNNVTLKADLSGSKLNIEVESKVTIGINLGFNDLKLYVYIPEDYSKSLAVKSTSGKIELGKMKLKNLSCRATSGSIEIEDITVEKFDYSNTSGSLKADTLYTKQSTIRSTSGSIKIDDFSGDLTGSQTSGSIDIDYKSFNNEIELESVSGSIKLKLPSSSEFALDARSTSGSINSEFDVTVQGEQDRKKLVGYVKSKDKKVSIKTTSGSIKIEKQ